MIKNFLNERRIRKAVEETDWSREQIERGYDLFQTVDNSLEVQRIDDLEQFGLGKFDDDTDALKQALKDGFVKSFKVEVYSEPGDINSNGGLDYFKYILPAATITNIEKIKGNGFIIDGYCIPEDFDTLKSVRDIEIIGKGEVLVQW